MNAVIARVFERLGALRAMMAALVLALVLLAPFAGGQLRLEGWALLTSVVAPALYVIMVFVLPLDMLMSLVFQAEQDAATRARFRFVLRVELALFVVLLASWAPFVYRVLTLRASV